jgi:hypothetical protein
MVNNRNSGFSTGVSPNQKFFSIDAMSMSMAAPTLSGRPQTYEYKDTQGPTVIAELPTNPIVLTTPITLTPNTSNNVSVLPNNSSNMDRLYQADRLRGSVDVSVPIPGSTITETVINTPATPKNILPKVLLVLVIAGVSYYGYKMFFAKSKTN